MKQDKLHIGGVELNSRLLVGTGKFGDNRILPEVMQHSGAEIVTMAIRRIDLDSKDRMDNILEFIPKDRIILPNTSGARNADEAVRIARLARAMGCGDWIKIEITWDNKYLLPDNEETIKATDILSKEGFIVLPYMNPDLLAGQKMIDAGAAAVMPLGSPIGTNRGFRTKEIVKIMIDELAIPIIVDAGIGKPSEACEVMELGAAAVLANTAIATSDDPVAMGIAFAQAISAGRMAYQARLGRVQTMASASSPLVGFLREGQDHELL